MHLDTIYALSSGRPPAAIAIVRISGPGAHGAARTIAGELPEARQAAVRELRDPTSRELLDEALILRFDGPASSTGEDLVEFHCHGGRAVVAAVLGALERLDGPRAARPGEFTRRAFENGRIDLTEAEGLADLIEAETESQRRAAIVLAEGGLRQQIAAWQRRILDLSARAEAAIDYVDEDLVDGDPELVADSLLLVGEIGEWLARPRAELLRDGVTVVLAGPPNAGKSSLLNVLAGAERAIVTDIPGTTRDHIEVSMALDGVPIRLIDTAGLRETGELVERLGVDRSRQLIETADILVWLGRRSEAPNHANIIHVSPKSDLARSSIASGGLPVSTVTGEGLSELSGEIMERARRILPVEGQVALNSRQSDCLIEVHAALQHIEFTPDLLLVAEQLRVARVALDRLTGRSGIEDVLDALFGSFCLGK